MSSDADKTSKPGGMPDGIPAPPPPKPSIQSPSASQPTYGKEEKGGKKKKKGRNHPTDPYEPLKQKKGCGGCCGCLGTGAVIGILLFAALVTAVLFFGPGRYVKEGYKVVNITDDETGIYEAPEVPTYYIGLKVKYDVPVTEVPIAIAASEITVIGEFEEDVSLTAGRVIAEKNSTFQKNLEVFAVEFVDKGITLKGELKGQVSKSTQ